MSLLTPKKKPGQELEFKEGSKDSAAFDELGCCNGAVSRAFPSGYKTELKATMNIAWALVVTQVCEQYFQPIAVMFGGHLGKLELDTIALSNTLINVLGNSVVIGMVSSCETAFSQCYGYGNYKMVSVYLQRGIYIHMMALLICYAIHLNIEPILLAIGQDPAVARLTGQYMLYFMPGVFFLFVNAILRRYTQCQSSVVPHIYIMLTGHGIHAVLQYVFLYELNLGIIGSALAQDFTFFYIFVCTLSYTLYSEGHKRCWGGWDWRGLLEWGPLAKLALFGLLMTCFEWWAFEISIILAGTIGTTELGAQSVAFNLDSLCYGIPFGIGIASGIRVGQSLGGDQPMRAKTAARVGMTLTITNGIIWAILYIAARWELPKLFTSDPAVISLVASISPVMALYTVGSGVNTVGRGVFRGIGWQLAGSVLSFVCFYIVAGPIALPLTFLTPLSIIGMWWGLFIAITCCGMLYFIIIIFRLNWNKLSEQAMKRAAATDMSSSDSKSTSDDETTLLLSASISFSQSIHLAATKDAKLAKDDPEQFTSALIIKRFATVSIVVIIFLTGLIVRLTTEKYYRNVDLDIRNTLSPINNNVTNDVFTHISGIGSTLSTIFGYVGNDTSSSTHSSVSPYTSLVNLITSYVNTTKV